MQTALRLSAGVLAGLILLGSAATAQDDQQEALKQRLEEKLKKDFLKNADWVLDYDQALKQAKESGKLIFAYFSRSYAP